MSSTPRARIERASGDDLMELAVDRVPAPMQVGAVLELAAGSDPEAVAAAVAGRIERVPRLRQRLVRTPPGCGRAIWVDDAAYDVAHHLRRRTLGAQAGRQALFDLATGLVTTPLPRDRPLWAARVVDGLAGGGSALVFVMHHVLADGVGGMAALRALADDGPVETGPATFPAGRPSAGELAQEALVARLRWLAALRWTWRRVPRGAAELGLPRVVLIERCSLNARTGPRRTLAVERANLTRVRDAAHAHGATVNDVVLCAVAGALGRLLTARGESARTLVVSVPVSARGSTSASRLGNRVGAMPIPVDARLERFERLRQVAAETARRRVTERAQSAALLVPVFRLLGAVGLFGVFVDHQRLVHTFVTNLHGPEQPLRVGGAEVISLVPVAPTPGNVTVSFGVMSYAGTLSISLLADPERVPDLPVLAGALRRELEGLCGA